MAVSGVFPVRYEYYLQIKKEISPSNRQWRHVFPVRYCHLYVISIVILVTACGNTYMWFLSGTNVIYILKTKALPVTGGGSLPVSFL
jgi:hypothetical protein